MNLPFSFTANLARPFSKFEPRLGSADVTGRRENVVHPLEKAYLALGLRILAGYDTGAMEMTPQEFVRSLLDDDEFVCGFGMPKSEAKKSYGDLSPGFADQIRAGRNLKRISRRVWPASMRRWRWQRRKERKEPTK